MLAHCKELLEYLNGMVAIHPKHNKLIISLRTAVEKGDVTLDKVATTHDDRRCIQIVLEVLALM